MLSTWFANPVFLLTLLALPVCLAFLVYGYLRRKRLTARLGSRLLLRKSVLVRPRVRRWKTFCVLLGLGLLGVACAGPHWGLDPDAQHRKGRDVILVLDMSRSMSAEQPSRRDLALLALRHLADEFEKHGGNRIALIAFASKAELLFPLTHDCDHLRHTLGQIEANDISAPSVDDPVSGTRIGAALKLAVASYDPRRANRPIIVLLSDGDDPVDDGEWQQGVLAAKEQLVRIHTVGIGDPRNAEFLYAGGERLTYDGKPVTTRLNERRLREIADSTGGSYLPARTEKFPLGAFVLHLLDADELRDEAPTENALPIYQLRYTWFLFPALLLFMLAMLLNEGPRLARNEPKMPTRSTKQPQRRFATKAVSLLLTVIAILGVSAADPPAADSLLRQGNEAFAKQDYEEALKFYTQAEGLTLDPGLVSFNKAAAYYRLNRHKEAIECYRRCLEDDKAPPDRRARAHFDLGNALVQYASDNVTILTDAVAAYRACLYQPDLPANLRTDARHNLEVAQLLWLEAWKKLPEDQKKEREKDKQADPPEDDVKGDIKYVPVTPDQNAKPQVDDNAPSGVKANEVRSLGLDVIRDDAKVQPISPEVTLATVEREARRIAAARRLMRNPAGPATLSTKDW